MGALLWLLVIPVGIAVAVVLRAVLPPSFAPGVEAVPLVVGVLIGVGFADTEWLTRSRIVHVQALHPDGLVLPARSNLRSDEFFEHVVRVPLSQMGWAYAVAADDSGLSVYRGTTQPERVLLVPWPHVLNVSVAVVSAAPDLGPFDYVDPALTVTVATSAHPVEFAFPVLKTPGPYQRGRVLEATRDEIWRRRQAALGLDVSAPARSFASPGRRILLPGVSSVAFWRAIRMLGWLGPVGLVAFLVVRFAPVPEGLRDLWMLPLGLLLLSSLGSLVLAILASRRGNAEASAGYTLSRTGDSRLDQVDPVSGYVIRQAGEMQLSRDAERAEIARVRALA
ncbi:hypothetical protein ACFJGV_15925 [Cnuibacter sp. UC19_7]|uniref:hypothetical protein n=1 Tax=Cnuibacter sp. UC19_7 TaxID=3350166 RepID=UPI00366D5D3C